MAEQLKDKQAEDEQIRAAAQRWLTADPDPVTKAELQQLLDTDTAELRRRFSGRVAFGTAGLRAQMGAGPTRINRVLIRIVASALAQRLKQENFSRKGVVIGYDARHGSHDFAVDTARVLASQQLLVTMLPEMLPTPVLAFAVKHLDAAAGVMVTASHNPRTDNGYKIYWHGGSLLSSPLDTEISELINNTAPLNESDLALPDDPLITMAGDEALEAYLDAVTGLLAYGGPRSLSIAYTPLHGVGAKTFCRALTKAGFDAPHLVAEQAEPDPDFVTTAFPNPEETGVVDRLLRLARDSDADIALAHDPDADRLAVAVPDGDSWRLLSGDETGCLLAEHLLSRSGTANAATAEPCQQRLVINTVVSSRLLSAIAAHHGVDWVETLTGFKWIMKAAAQRPDHELVLAYEDALGYVAGRAVNDKDGIGAGLVIAELAARLKAQQRTLVDLLDDLSLRHGAHVTGQRSIRFESAADERHLITQAMQQLRELPPAELAGATVTAVHDFANGSEHLPATDLMGFDFHGGSARVLVRPSGTEPKIKVYGEVIAGVARHEADSGRSSHGDEPHSAQATARVQMTELVDATVRYVADFERRAPELTSGTSGTSVASAELSAGSGLAPTQSKPAGNKVFDSLNPDDLRLVVRCTDLTTLQGDDTPGRIRALCAEALRPDPADPTVGPAAAVCLYPAFVALAAELLAGTPVAVASVAGGFPSGLSPLEVKIAEVQAAVAGGAQEIDTVLNRGAFLSGDTETTATELRALKEAAAGAHFKVILEVCELGSTALIAEATQLALDAGATMIKTSTGKGSAGASLDTVTVIAETIAAHCAAGGQPVGIKIAGGIRNAADAVSYVNVVRSVLGTQWLNPEHLRFGASSLLADVVSTLAHST